MRRECKDVRMIDAYDEAEIGAGEGQRELSRVYFHAISEFECADLF
jgi:hypothetical protein